MVDATKRRQDVIAVRMWSLEPHDVVAAICPRKRLNWGRVMAAARMQPQLASEDLATLAGSFDGMFKPLSGRMEDVFEDRPVEVEAIGTGVMLISRSVLEHLMAQGVQRVRMGSQQIELNVFFEETVVNGFHTSEDISFCHKVRRAGGRVWGVPWFRMAHGGNYDHIGDIGAISRAPIWRCNGDVLQAGDSTHGEPCNCHAIMRGQRGGSVAHVACGAPSSSDTRLRYQIGTALYRTMVHSSLPGVDAPFGAGAP